MFRRSMLFIRPQRVLLRQLYPQQRHFFDNVNKKFEKIKTKWTNWWQSKPKDDYDKNELLSNFVQYTHNTPSKKEVNIDEPKYSKLDQFKESTFSEFKCIDAVQKYIMTMDELPQQVRETICNKIQHVLNTQMQNGRIEYCADGARGYGYQYSMDLHYSEEKDRYFLMFACAGVNFAVKQEVKWEKETRWKTVGTNQSKGWFGSYEKEDIVKEFTNWIQIPIPKDLTRKEVENLVGCQYNTYLTDEARHKAQAAITQKKYENEYTVDADI
eukprot:356511_1